jgi:prophage regulatory protein
VAGSKLRGILRFKPVITGRILERQMSELRQLNRLYRLRDLPQFVGLRKTQIADLVRSGEFPKPVRLTDGGRAVAWLETDLIEWQTSRVAARDVSTEACD